ncbi:DUF1796 family putative cysteine peptidase [Bacillus sp. FDAARGOS_1420]|uniref:DUF1796 family putative cysteine peptidase n=1 Tax=unclassified Bacillus (in: firmicutes) TaxID=185979 RepID=UPI001C5BD579|nr:DUF1796 family putative cysteine peptidase [Bacillus sp. FDAARGOS_1420]MBW3496785.1 papain-like cysteine peptidase [Bacillus sp. FDAARGOS_1420]
MRLEDIKGNYDAIYSLGDLCLTALQLRKNKLRPTAGPLDWMSSPSLSNVSRLLKNRFMGYMELQNLVPSGYSTGVDSKEPHLCVTDIAYQIISSHDFKADKNSFTNLATYSEVKAKFDRRVQRFLDMISNGKRIMFIRTEGEFEEVLELDSVLTQLVINDFTLLLVNHTNTPDLVENDWPLEKVCAIELPNVEKWNGNNDYWSTIFKGIKINEKE